jgi:hypothetical protein
MSERGSPAAPQAGPLPADAVAHGPQRPAEPHAGPRGNRFPKVLEIEAIQVLRRDFVKLIQDKYLSGVAVGAHRRFIVPKDEIAYRFCCANLPADETRYFINRWTFDRPFDAVLAKWAKST